MNCPVCGCHKNIDKYFFGEYFFKKCKKCKSLFLVKKNEHVLGESLYEENYFEDYKFDKGDKFNYFQDSEKKISSNFSRVNFLKRFVNPKDKRLLDVGCAAGYFLESAKREGFSVEGVEISGSASSFAKKQFGINIVGKDLKSVDFKDRYDVVTFYHVLEHLKDPESYIKKSNEILKSGGILLIEVPNYRSIDFMFNNDSRKRIASVPYHETLFSFNGLVDLIKRNNFIILEKKIFLSSIIFDFVKKILFFIKNIFSFKKVSIKQDSLVEINEKLILNNNLYYLKKIIGNIFPGGSMIFVCKKKD